MCVCMYECMYEYMHVSALIQVRFEGLKALEMDVLETSKTWHAYAAHWIAA